MKSWDSEAVRRTPKYVCLMEKKMFKFNLSFLKKREPSISFSSKLLQFADHWSRRLRWDVIRWDDIVNIMAFYKFLPLRFPFSICSSPHSSSFKDWDQLTRVQSLCSLNLSGYLIIGTQVSFLNGIWFSAYFNLFVFNGCSGMERKKVFWF